LLIAQGAVAGLQGSTLATQIKSNLVESMIKSEVETLPAITQLNLALDGGQSTLNQIIQSAVSMTFVLSSDPTLTASVGRGAIEAIPSLPLLPSVIAPLIKSITTAEVHQVATHVSNANSAANALTVSNLSQEIIKENVIASASLTSIPTLSQATVVSSILSGALQALGPFEANSASNPNPLVSLTNAQVIQIASGNIIGVLAGVSTQPALTSDTTNLAIMISQSVETLTTNTIQLLNQNAATNSELTSAVNTITSDAIQSLPTLNLTDPGKVLTSNAVISGGVAGVNSVITNITTKQELVTEINTTGVAEQALIIIPPTAILTDNPVGISNVISLNITVAGNDVQAYKYKIGPTSTTTCSVSGNYSSEINSNIHITDSLVSFSDQSLTLCVLGKDSGNIWQLLSSASSSTWLLDTTPPQISGLNDDPTPRTSKTWNWSCTDVNGPCSYRYVINTNPTYTFTNEIFVASTTASQTTGTNNYYLHIQAKDSVGNLSATANISTILNNTVPTVVLGNPSASTMKSTDTIIFTATYAEASLINLANTDIVFSGTASAGCIASVSGIGTTTRIISVTGCSGDGLMNINIAANSAQNSAGIPAQASSLSSPVTIDNTLPLLTGLSDDASTLSSKTWTWGCTDTNAPCTYRYVIDTNATYTFTNEVFASTTSASQLSGVNTFYIHVQAKDAAGNISTTTNVSVIINNLAPYITLSSPSSSLMKAADTITYTATYTGAFNISLVNTDVLFTGAAVACVASVSGTGTTTRSISVTGCSTDGSLQISIAANSAQNEVGTEAVASSLSTALIVDNTLPLITGISTDATPHTTKTWTWGCTDTNTPCTYRYVIDTSATYTFTNEAFSSTTTANQSTGSNTYYLHVQVKDAAGNISATTNVSTILNNTAPTVALSAPSALLMKSTDTITYTATYTGAATVTLADSDIIYTGVSTGCAATVTGTGTTTRTISITGCSANGSLQINIATNTAANSAGVQAVASSLSTALTVDNTLPLITGLSTDATPHTTKTWTWGCTDTNTPCTYRYVIDTSATYTFTNEAFSSTTTANQSTGSNTYYLHVQVKDAAGNISATTNVSTILNNTAPTVALSAPSALLMKSTDTITYTATYTGAATVTLADSDIIYTGVSTGCAATVTGTGTTTRTISITGCSANGSLQINIATNTAANSAGVQAVASSLSTALTVDNTLPLITGLSTDATPHTTKTWTWGCTDTNTPCTYRYVIDTSATYTFTNEAFSSTTTANQSTGSNTYYLHVQVKDAAGNISATTNVSTILNNTAPTVALSAPSALLMKSTDTITYTATYTGAATVTLADSDIIYTGVSTGCAATVTGTGTTTRTISITGCSANGSLQINIAANTATNNTSIQAAASSLSTAVTVDNIIPLITGLSDDATPQSNKTWTWACDELNGPCTYRYIIDTNATYNFTNEIFSSTATATQPSGTTTYYIHVQAKDAAGNISATTQVSAILNGIPPAITSFSDGSFSPKNNYSAAATWTVSDVIIGLYIVELSVGSTPGATDVAAWRDYTWLNPAFVKTATLTPNTKYYTNIRVRDWKGSQVSQSGDGWVYNEFTQTQKIVATNRESNASFGGGTGNVGGGVAISEDGSTMIVGSPKEDTDANGANPIMDAGAAYIYIWNSSTSNWDLQIKLVAIGTNARVASDLFGSSVAISGNTVAIGAIQQDFDGGGLNSISNAGAVYIFKRTAGVWAPEQKLVPTGSNDRVINDNFGNSVAISGDSIVVGSSKQDYDSNGANSISDAGAAYVFKRSGTTWSLQQKLQSSGMNARIASDNFGSSVSISGDTVVVGAKQQSFDSSGGNPISLAGAAYIFTRFNNIWTQQQKIVATGVNARMVQDNFGSTLSISGDSLIVGAYGQDYNATGENLVDFAGAAYVFTRSGSVWTQQQKLVPSGLNSRFAMSVFGYSVGMVGDTAVIGAVYDSYDSSGTNYLQYAGAAYVFSRQGTLWTQQQKLIATGSSARMTTDYFGIFLAVAGDKFGAAAMQDYDANGNSGLGDAGAVYAFSNSRPTLNLTATGNNIQSANQTDFIISGFCNQEGQTITLSGFSGTVTNAPVLCTGSQWTAHLDLTSQSEGSFNITISYVINGITYPTTKPFLKYTTPPTLSSFDDGISVNGIIQSPSASWAAATTSSAGLDRYELAVGTTAGGTEVMGWTSVGNVLTAQLTLNSNTILSSGVTYYTSLRVFDRAGNVSSVLNGDGWIYYGFSQIQKIAATNRETSENYGSAIAISEDGSTLVVGAPNDDLDDNGINALTDAGAAYVYLWNSGTSQWDLQKKLVPPVGANTRVASDKFGSSVAISEDTIAVGAFQQDYDAGGAASLADAGAVYVFTRSAGVWSPQQKIVATGTNARIASDNFGASVAIKGDTLAVGAYKQDYDVDGATAVTDSGAVYIYSRSGGVWTTKQKIVGIGTNARIASDYFGYSLAISENTLVVGAYQQDFDLSGNASVTDAGAAYIFTLIGSVWSMQQKIIATGTNARVTTDNFGYNVAVSGDSVVIGANNQDFDVDGNANTSNAGAAYVFTRSGKNWSQQQKLIATGSLSRDTNYYFGNSVAISGDTILVGSYQQSYNALGADLFSAAGAAFVYSRNGNIWTQQQKIVASGLYGRNPNDNFGNQVSLSGSVIVIGAKAQDYAGDGSSPLTDSGAVYAFRDTLPMLNLTSTGAILNPNNKSSFSLSGRCNQSGQAITLSGFTGTVVSAPTCNGSTWNAILDLTSQPEGNFNITISFVINAITYQTTIPFTKNTSLPTLSNFSDGSLASVVLNQSPLSTWDAASSTIGVDHYELSVGTTSGGTDFANWTSVGNVLSATLTLGANITPGTIYYSSLRAVDSIGNYSAVSYGDGWIYNSGFNQNQKLAAEHREASGYYGSAMAISEDGSTLIVGAYQDDTDASGLNAVTSAGAAYVYVWNSGTSQWNFQQKLVATTRVANDFFGFSVAISGDSVAIGAYQQDTDASGASTSTDAGAAYVFTRSGGVWTQQQKVVASGVYSRIAYDRFGYSVGIVGDTLAVGAKGQDYDSIGGGTALYDAGAIYLFIRSANVWTQQQILVPSGPNARRDYEYLDSNLAMSGDTLIAGISGHDYDSNGSAYLYDAGAAVIFVKKNNLWLQQQIISASGPNARTSNSYFGASVAISGDTVVVGSNGQAYDGNGLTSIANSGAAFVFNRIGGVWTQQQKLAAFGINGRVTNDNFGTSVAISGDSIIVGAKLQDYDSNGTAAVTDSGAIYTYIRNGSNWTQQQKLVASNTNARLASDYFGLTLAVSGDRLAVGAYPQDYDTNGSTLLADAGAIYNFKDSRPQLHLTSTSNSINSANQTSYTISGRCTESGQLISISGFTGTVTNAPVTCNGSTWTAILDFSTLADGNYTFTFWYVIAGATYQTSNTYFKSSTMPTLSSLNDGISVTAVYQTPTTTWSAATSTVGVDHYELSVGTTPGGTDIVGWTNVGNTTTATLNINSNIILSSPTYYTSLRVMDVVGNYSSVLQGDGWNYYGFYQTNKMVAAAREASTNYGLRSALSEDGSTLVVGALLDDTDGNGLNPITNSGAAYVFIWNGSTNQWDLQQKIVSTIGTNARMDYDNFGSSVAISGDTLVVGAYSQDYDASGNNFLNGAGAAYVFTRSGGDWTQQQKIIPSGPNARIGSGQFGSTIAISGDILVIGVGNHGYDYNGENYMSNAGAAFVFNRSGGVWSQQQKLVPSGTNARSASDGFGSYLAISGETIVIGSTYHKFDSLGENLVWSAGAAFVYTRIGSVWSQQQKIIPTGKNNRNQYDYFGGDIALSGDTLVVGAYGHDYNEIGLASVSDAGAAFIFTRGNGNQWSQQQKIVGYFNNARLTMEYFGIGLGMSGDTIVVGAPYGGVAGAFVYNRVGNTWSQQQTIIGMGTNARISNNYYGNYLKFSGQTVLASAPYDSYDESGNNYLVSAGALYTNKTRTPILHLTSTGNAINANNKNAFYISGLCDQNTQVITISGLSGGTVTNAPVTCNGSTWLAQLNFASQADGNFDLNFSYIVNGGTYQTTKTFTKQVTLPTMSTIDDGTSVLAVNQTPATSWAAAVSGGASIDHYELAVGSTAGGSDVGPWTSVGLTLSTVLKLGYASATLSSGSTYYTSVRAVDAVGNISSSVNGNGWVYYGYSQNQKLAAVNREASGSYGSVVALSEDGTTLVVGALKDDTDASGANALTDAGAAYVYIWNTDTSQWDFQQKLVPAAGTNARLASDYFGASVGISGDTIIVGATQQDYNAIGTTSVTNAGAAYVFTRTAGTWAQIQKIVATGTNSRITNDNFGSSVSIAGTTMVISALLQDYDDTGANGITDAGAAFVYIWNSGSSQWDYQQKLVPTAGTNSRVASDNFGSSVALSGDTVIIGAKNQDYDENGNALLTDAGAAFLFKRTGGVWSQQQKLVSFGFFGRGAGDSFGGSVAISGDTVVIGAVGHSYDLLGLTPVTSAGAAFVFTNTGFFWTQQQKLVALGTNSRMTGDNFGASVSISGDTIVVGAQNQSYDLIGINSITSSGAAYIFTRSVGFWSQQQKIISTGGNAKIASDIFGSAVVIAKDTIVIGANAQDYDISGANLITDAGAVYSYRDLRPMIGLTTSGNAITAANQSTFTIAGTCNQSGQTITLSGFTGTVVNAPVTCNGKTWTAILDLTGQSDGSFNITVSYIISGITYQTINPYIKSTSSPTLSTIDDGVNGFLQYQTPKTTWTAATSTVGVHHYELAVGTSAGATNISSWTNVGNVLSANLNFTTPLTSGSTYYTSLKVFDVNGVASSPLNGDGWVFNYNGFSQHQKLAAVNRQSSANYGSSEAISEDGTTLVVGSPDDSTDASGLNPVNCAGAAYVYIWNSGSNQWDFQQKIVATGASRVANGYFGSSVAISGNTIALGASSQGLSVFIFTRSGGVWTQQQNIIPTGTNASEGLFGLSVALAGDTLIAGAQQQSYDADGANYVNSAGAAFVFTRSGSVWTQQQKLVATGVNARSNFDYFGYSVAISGETIVIGSYGNNYDALGANIPELDSNFPHYNLMFI
jgi:hypothetical protein